MAERSTGARQSDEEILAALDAAPDAFAAFYRRHVAELLRDLLGRTNNAPLAAELCAETFAAALDGAHRFDPSHGSAAAWLFQIAEREIAHAERIGAPRDRARRRLGLAPLQPPRDALAGLEAGPAPRSGFVVDLEEELVAAARFRAQRRSRRLELPRPPRAAIAGAATLALVAVVAALLLRRGEGDTTAGERSAAVLPPSATFRLPPMQPLAPCAEPARAALGDAAPVHGIDLLSRPQRATDALPFDPRMLPIASFDPRSTRRVRHSRPWSTVYVVPSPEVASDGQCDSYAGPGLCLVAEKLEFRCFKAADVEGGKALARTSAATALGIVPDGVERVTIYGTGPPAVAAVDDNVYEARVDAPVGLPVRVAFDLPGGDGCRRTVAPELLSEVALLRAEPRRGFDLPQAAHDALRHWPLDAVVEEGARYWGGGVPVEFWAVPVVPRGRPVCAPASRVCVVAVGERSQAAAQCVLGRNRRGRNWWLGHLSPGHSLIFGTVPDGVTGVRVTTRDATIDVDARGNVFGGVLPFRYPLNDPHRIRLLR